VADDIPNGCDFCAAASTVGSILVISPLFPSAPGVSLPLFRPAL
jgi:hypothetical protein